MNLPLFRGRPGLVRASLVLVIIVIELVSLFSCPILIICRLPFWFKCAPSFPARCMQLLNASVTGGLVMDHSAQVFHWVRAIVCRIHGAEANLVHATPAVIAWAVV